MESDVRQSPAILNMLATAATGLAGIALLGMVVVQGWQVFARYVLNNSPSWTEPLALFFMATAMMLGASLGVRREAHFGFFIAVESAPLPVRRALRLFARLVAAAIGGMFAVYGAMMFVDGIGISLAGAPLPQSITYLPLCIGGALIFIFAIERMIFPAEEASAH